MAIVTSCDHESHDHTFRQHTVPRFLLKHFVYPSDSKQVLWAVNRDGKVYEQGLVKEASVSNHEYCDPFDGQLTGDEHEKAFADLEGRSTDSVKRFANLEDVSELTEEDQLHMAKFVYVQFWRSKRVRELVKQFDGEEKQQAHIKNLLEHYPWLSKIEVGRPGFSQWDLLRTDVEYEKKLIGITINNLVFANLEREVSKLLNRRWCVVNTLDPLIVGDSPVDFSYVPFEDGASLMSGDIRMPLNRNRFLLILDEKVDGLQVEVRHSKHGQAEMLLNIGQAQRAYKELFVAKDLIGVAKNCWKEWEEEKWHTEKQEASYYSVQLHKYDRNIAHLRSSNQWTAFYGEGGLPLPIFSEINPVPEGYEVISDRTPRSVQIDFTDYFTLENQAKNFIVPPVKEP